LAVRSLRMRMGFGTDGRGSIGCGDGSYSTIFRTARLFSFADAALMMVRMA